MVFSVGKRKTAKARATLKEGTGKISINKESLENWPHYLQLMILEPLRLSGITNVDIRANVTGGGQMGQAEAVRLAIARALLEYTKDENLKNKFLAYDRNLLVEDSRRTEVHKPSQSSKGPRHKRQKSYR